MQRRSRLPLGDLSSALGVGHSLLTSCQLGVEPFDLRQRFTETAREPFDLLFFFCQLALGAAMSTLQGLEPLLKAKGERLLNLWRCARWPERARHRAPNRQHHVHCTRRSGELGLEPLGQTDPHPHEARARPHVLVEMQHDTIDHLEPLRKATRQAGADDIDDEGVGLMRAKALKRGFPTKAHLDVGLLAPALQYDLA